MGKLAKNKYLTVDKKSKLLKLSQLAIDNQGVLCIDKTKDILSMIKKNAEEHEHTEIENSVEEEMKKAKLISTATIKCCKVAKGPEYNINEKKDNLQHELKHDMIARMIKGEDVTFKPLNLKAKGKRPNLGTLHNVTKVRNNMKQILLEMGFEEMPTNKWIESSFWNFDSLFQPQQHPARDAHDTFFMKKPLQCDKIDPNYMKVVKDTHENGGSTGSIGYKYNWSEDESRT